MKKWRAYSRQDKNLFRHLLKLRGLKEDDLTLDFEKLHNPNLLPDMEKAVTLIKQAVTEKWPILIFGDYDADGTPAAALLYRTLKKIGLSVEVELPKREVGYGLRQEYIGGFAERAKLLITVDTGITSVEEVALAKKLGLKVIILDHHLPQDKLPRADALIDAHLENSKYPFKGLCGCALAYKFLVALSEEFPQLSEGFRKWLLDIVAISTVADMMVMADENRILTFYGLKVLQKTRNPGLKALLDVMGITSDKLTVDLLGYGLGPRLNAGGRMGDNRPALELLITDDPEEAARLSREINQTNARRQSKVDEILKEAQVLVWQQNEPEDRLLAITSDDWPSGIVGLVAGRLVQIFHRPVIMGGHSGEEIIGSARSIEKYPIIEGLTAAASHLLRFGGHRQAAGFSLRRKDWTKFTQAIKKHAQGVLSPEDLIPEVTADAVLTQEEINLKTALDLEKLAPFGMGYPEPVFILPGVVMDNLNIIGRNQDHLKALAQIGDTYLELVGFGMAGRVLSQNHDTWHLMGHLEINRWNGKSRLQFRFFDYLPGSDNFEIVSTDGQASK